MPHASPTLRRRQLLAVAAASTASAWPRLSLAGQVGPGQNRLVLVLLRGALDGLAAVPAPGDPQHAAARGLLAQFGAPPLPLDGLLALHPLLPQMHAMYGAGELAVLHAVAMPYPDRSHFDAQLLLESGGQRPAELSTGWLGRALAGGPGHGKAMAFQPTVPLALRGLDAVDTWAPPQRQQAGPEALAELGARLQALYTADPALAQALARAQALHGQGMAGAAAVAAAGGVGRAAELGRQAAAFLARPDGPQAALLELGGWDSHANQAVPPAATAGAGPATVAAAGTLAGPLQALDAMLAALRDGLSSPAPGQPDAAWSRTVVLVVTEFGRTVAMNGSRGTDHGTGGAAFVLGGAVKGGQVITDWPSLAEKERLAGRDLRPTTDLRAVFKTVLHQHLQLPLAAIGSTVLPGSQALAMLPLLRG